jgi:asparagine synthase (glutamine-hydrolysing)
MQLPTALWRRQLAFRGHPIATKERPWREYSAIHPNFADAQEIDDLGGEWLETYLPRTRVDERNALLHTLMRQDVGLVDHNLNVLHGVELRNPLADIRIIAYCLSIPNHLFHSWDLPRPLIRIAMRGLLPDSVLLNCTRGVQGADIYRRLRAHRSRILEDLDRLNESELAREVLDLSRMRAATEQWLNQGGVATPIINPLLVFGLSMGRFLIWLEREGIH